MDDPLIVMLGIGEYNDLPNLAGIVIDYQNIVNTFVGKWKYKIFCQLNDDNNTVIYTNDKQEIDTLTTTNKNISYKLKWTMDEIELFIEQARKCIVKNKHNGLMFAISSHGDTGKVLYDSNCEEFDLDSIFSMFSPQASMLLESYKETPQESLQLFTIPKIFFLDMCRGSFKAKVTDISSVPTTPSTIPLHKNNNNFPKKPNILKSKTNTENASKTESVDGIKLKSGKKKEKMEMESFAMKTVHKEQAHWLVTQMANFCKLYANIEGCSVADGSNGGGFFLRNVCKCFNDTKFVLRHKWTDIIFKIREYTKRDATIVGDLFNFTQIVENEGTLERPVRFSSQYIKLNSKKYNNHFAPTPSLLSQLDNNYNFNANNFNDSNHISAQPINEDATIVESTFHLTITNASVNCDIAVLVEMEQNAENRQTMIETLTKVKINTSEEKDEDDSNEFSKNGFVTIKQGDSHIFDKIWDSVWITLFELDGNQKNRTGMTILQSLNTSTPAVSRNSDSNNLNIYDRRAFFNDDLYYRDSKLYKAIDILPACCVQGSTVNTIHSLTNITYGDNDNDKSKLKYKSNCFMCDSELKLINPNDYHCYQCQMCEYAICSNCCRLIICKKTPFEGNINPAPSITYAKQKSLHLLQLECILPQNYIDSVHPLLCEVSLSSMAANSSNIDTNFDDRHVHVSALDVKADMSHFYNSGSVGGSIFDLEIPINDWQKELELKEDSLDCELELKLIDKTNNIHSFNSDKYKIKVYIRGFTYSYRSIFTTLNGKGKFGPDIMAPRQNVQEEKEDSKSGDKVNIGNHDHLGDAKLISIHNPVGGIAHRGMQIWTVPRSGFWRIVCYGAKGGDSTGKSNELYKANHLVGGKGAKVGGTIQLYKNDQIKILCGQMGISSQVENIAGGGGGGTYFVLYKRGAGSPNIFSRYGTMTRNTNNTNNSRQSTNINAHITDIPLIIAAGGHGACNAEKYSLNGIDGLCDCDENRDNYGGYQTNGRAGRGGSFEDDNDVFKSYIEVKNQRENESRSTRSTRSTAPQKNDYNQYNGQCWITGGNGGKGVKSGIGKYIVFDHRSNGGFGGGGGGSLEGGAGGGYIGGVVQPQDENNSVKSKYKFLGALSYNCCTNSTKIMQSGYNNGDGKVKVTFVRGV